MARARAKVQKAEPSAGPDPLSALKSKLGGAGFNLELDLDSPGDGEACAIVWGRHRGEETPRIFLLALPAGAWDRANVDHVQERMWARTPTDTPADAYPQFGVVSDGAHEAFFNLGYPAHQIDQLPTLEEIREFKRIEADPTYRWSMRMYHRLQQGFNAFHEQVYQTVKDRVNGKNDIILEVAKFLFLESFRLHHRGDNLVFTHERQKLRLDEVFTVEYVQAHKAKAVTHIQAAFDHFKTHPDYVVTDDKGQGHPIFDTQTHLLLAQPRNYETLLDLIQNLPPVSDNQGRPVASRGPRPKQGCLLDVAGDVLGRAFDVFLRANFDSKGGIGIYLTPAPVKQCMLGLAFHDILKETPELLTARNPDDTPAFRYGDPACGTYGFGVVAIGYLKRALEELTGRETGSDARREKLFAEMGEHSFVGADSSPQMVTLARINMALLGAPKAKIFYTQNSLVSDQLKPCSFDLICTNPPFGTPKFTKDQAEARRRYEEDMEKILEIFRSDLTPREGKRDVYTYEPTVAGLAMGASPDRKNVWKPAGPTSVDPAVMFLDRCLQLLKPGGRLLIILPDGVLCNSGDKYVREYIMGVKDETSGQFHGGKAIVKAVISLPADTFKLSGTGAKTSILYLQKRHARPDDLTRFEDEPQTDVFMAVADTLGYEVKKDVEDYSGGVPNDLAAIAGAYIRGE
jgi:type I restriction enzyme M protein